MFPTEWAYFYLKTPELLGGPASGLYRIPQFWTCLAFRVPDSTWDDARDAARVIARKMRVLPPKRESDRIF